MMKWRLGGTADRALALRVLRGKRDKVWVDLLEEMAKRSEYLQTLVQYWRN